MKQIVLKDVFTAIIDDFRDNESFRDNERWGSAHIYQSALNAFLAFSDNPRFKLKDLSPAVLKHFEQYLRKRNCSWNTVATYMRSLRSAYNRCVDIGRVPYVPRLVVWMSDVYPTCLVCLSMFIQGHEPTSNVLWIRRILNVCWLGLMMERMTVSRRMCVRRG